MNRPPQSALSLFKWPLLILALLLLFTGLWLIVGTGNNGRPGPPTGAAPAGGPAPVEWSTCPICGYQTLRPDSLYCPVCYVELSEAERLAWEYPSMEAMIREEQAMFFAAEGYQDSVSFFAPLVWETNEMRYRKDTSWRPSVSADYVRRLRDTLIEAEVIELLE